MPATEPGSGAQRSGFVPRCAAPRWLACWLLALAGCLNPVPDTDPSVVSTGAIDAPANDLPANGGADNSDPGQQLNEGEGAPQQPASPVVNPPEMDGSVPDAGAPPPVDAGADAHSEDQQGEDEQ